MPKEKINSLQGANLEDSGAGGNSVVSDSSVAAGQYNVGLTANWRSSVRCHWDGYTEATSDSSCWGENWASDGDESSVDLRRAVSGGDDGAGSQESDGASNSDVAIGWCRCKHGESLNVQ